MNEEVIKPSEDEVLLQDVISKIPYIMLKDLLVKPLADEYVEVEYEKPMPTGEKDENGFDIMENETMIEERLTNFKKGVVLKECATYVWKDGNGDEMNVWNIPSVGDIVVYPRKQASPFDLFKNSELVNPYNVVAVIKKSAQIN